MRQGDARDCRRCYDATDARHDLARHTCRGAGFDLLAGATEDGGIAALEPDHMSPGLGVFDHQLLDPPLAGLHVVAWALADIDDLGARFRLGEKFRRRQTIVQHDVGGP